MTPLASFYRGKTVLITGHTGFKGGWLASWLNVLGARVVGFALPPEAGRPSLCQAVGLEDEVVSVMGDIRDYEALLAVVRKHQPEVVFHLAAQPLVRRSYREPVETLAANVMGTAHLLEAVRWADSVRSVVVVTSDKCYENREWVWGYREADPMGGHDPYSASKGCAELVTAAYRSAFFSGAADRVVGIASARAGNVIGGGDWAEDRIIPDIAGALSRNQPVVLRNPGATRPWQHVLEPLRGYLMLGERLWHAPAETGEGWNFGPAEADCVPVLELARRFVACWGSGEIVTRAPEAPAHEAHLLRLDCAKARTRLRWHPTLTLGEAVALTVDWYRSYERDDALAREVTDRQIRAYAERVDRSEREHLPARTGALEVLPPRAQLSVQMFESRGGGMPRSASGMPPVQPTAEPLGSPGAAETMSMPELGTTG